MSQDRPGHRATPHHRSTNVSRPQGKRAPRVLKHVCTHPLHNNRRTRSSCAACIHTRCRAYARIHRCAREPSGMHPAAAHSSQSQLWFPRTALRLVRGTRGRVAVANEKSAVLCSQRQRVGRLVVVVEGRGGREAEEDRARVLRSMSRIRPYLKNRSCGRHGPTAKTKTKTKNPCQRSSNNNIEGLTLRTIQASYAVTSSTRASYTVTSRPVCHRYALSSSCPLY